MMEKKDCCTAVFHVCDGIVNKTFWNYVSHFLKNNLQVRRQSKEALVSLQCVIHVCSRYIPSDLCQESMLGTPYVVLSPFRACSPQLKLY